MISLIYIEKKAYIIWGSGYLPYCFHRSLPRSIISMFTYMSICVYTCGALRYSWWNLNECKCRLSHQLIQTHFCRQCDLKLLNPFMASIPHDTETSQLISKANQLTGFYMIGNSGCWWVKPQGIVKMKYFEDTMSFLEIPKLVENQEKTNVWRDTWFFFFLTCRSYFVLF